MNDHSLQSAFLNIHRSGVLTPLFGRYMAGAFLNIHPSGALFVVTWLVPFWIFTEMEYVQRCMSLHGCMVPRETAAVSAHVLCTPYDHACAW